jgi:hypothetical protein
VTAAFGSDIAAVDGNRVILDGDPAEPPTVAQDDLYIAFVSLGDGPGLRSWLAILLVTMPTVLATFTSLHLPGLIVLLFGLAVAHVRRIQREEALAGTAPAFLLWVAGAIAAYLAIGFTIFPPIYPHPMLNTILATSLLVYALLVAGGSWVLYPVFGQLFGD